MTRTLIALLCVSAPSAMPACLSFGEPEPGSACRSSSPELVWLNAPPSAQRAPNQRGSFDPLIDDPSFATGVYAAGESAFQLRAQGKHLVEVFLTSLNQDKDSFVLEANGAAIDTRNVVKPGPDRYMPTSSTRRVVLLGIVEGGASVKVRTRAGRYVLSAVRWTPRETFESRLVPVMLERVRKLLADPFTEDLLSRRTGNIQHLCDRLVLSSREPVRREALLGLTRAHYWAAAENHRARDLDRLEQLFEQGLKVMPDDQALRQMVSASCAALNIGRVGHMPGGAMCAKAAPVPWEPDLAPPPRGAPEWAVAQRRLAARMDAITRWWVEKRQRPNGELGGGWDDDSEILRYWGPQALGLGSAVAAAGIRKLATGLWSSGIVLNGYDRRVSDVEHASEASADTQPILAALLPGDPAVRARLAETTACAEHWIVRQPDGHWRFRGAWFNCREFDPRPERAVDVHLNLRAVGPALWHAYLTRDPKVIRLLADWADSWVVAMRSTAHGKPAGIFPSAVKSADGSYLIGSDRWDKPSVEWDYYQWSGWSQETLTSLLLAVHDLTGDARWLQAAGESFQIVGRCGDFPRLCEQIKSEPQAYYEWRRRTGDARFDKAFGHDPKPSLAATLALMTAHARRVEERLGANFDMFTSEALYTDRVYYSMTPQYRQLLFGAEAPRGERYPTFAATWPAANGEFARAVIAAKDTELGLHFYNFGSREMQVPLRVWRLKAGTYQWESRDLQGAPVSAGEVAITHLPQVVQLTLPPRKEITVSLRRAR
jgi:hypothetical protein